MDATSTDTETTARTAETAAYWAENPDRLVTVSTGIVHVAIMGGKYTLCGTRTACRSTAAGIAPTCKNCGAK